MHLPNGMFCDCVRVCMCMRQGPTDALWHCWSVNTEQWSLNMWSQSRPCQYFLAVVMSGSTTRRHTELGEYGLDTWPPPSSSSMCYHESDCVLSTPPQYENAARDTSTSFWFSRQEAAFNYDNALFGGSNHFSDDHNHFYDQRHLSSSAVTARPLPTPLQPLPSASTCSDFAQPTFDRFTSDPYEVVELQPLQHGPSYPWLSSMGDGYVGAVRQDPFSQCLNHPVPGGVYGRGLDVPAWVSVKSERRSSSSATSSNYDGGLHASKLVQSSPSYCEDHHLKQEMFGSGSVRPSFDEFNGKDDWSSACCQSDASPQSSVDQSSDAVLLHNFLIFITKLWLITIQCWPGDLA